MAPLHAVLGASLQIVRLPVGISFLVMHGVGHILDASMSAEICMLDRLISYKTGVENSKLIPCCCVPMMSLESQINPSLYPSNMLDGVIPTAANSDEMSHACMMPSHGSANAMPSVVYPAPSSHLLSMS